MTYQQYTDHLKLCQYLGKEPLGEFKEFHDFISDLWKDMTFSVINDHNEQCIIFHKGTDFFMQQDFKNGKLKCQWDRIWSFFLIKKGMEIPELKDFIQSMVEQHLKCKVLTPLTSFHRWKNQVGQHLKCKVLTPFTHNDIPTI